MFDSHLQFATRQHLLRVKEEFSQDCRLDYYDAIQAAATNIDPWCLLTITTTTPIMDAIKFEGLCRRLVHQLHRAVLGMRKKSMIPILVVLERGANKALHGHLLIGKPIGATRILEKTTFKHYLEKRPFPALLRILQRLSYGTGSNSQGRIGVFDITPVYCREGLVDYLLKSSRAGIPQVAWLASNLPFQKLGPRAFQNVAEEP